MSFTIRLQTGRLMGIARSVRDAVAVIAVCGSTTCLMAQVQPAETEKPAIAPATETAVKPAAASPAVIEPAMDPAMESVAETAAASNSTVTNSSAATEPATWQIAIIPATGFDRSIRQVREGVAMPTYREAYNAVPFNRAEYEANPGYRHDAAMEIMFGQLRPTTIVRQYTPQAFRYPRPTVRYYTPPFGPFYNYGNYGYRASYNPILAD